MELILAAIAVVFFFLWRAARKNADVAHAHITSQAVDADLEKAGFIVDSVKYAVYRGRPYALSGSAVVVGIGRLASGAEAGFVCEAHDQYGCLGFKLIEPYGIAASHKRVSLASLESGQPMSTIFSTLMREHTTRHSQPEPASAKSDQSARPLSPQSSKPSISSPPVQKAPEKGAEHQHNEPSQPPFDDANRRIAELRARIDREARRTHSR